MKLENCAQNVNNDITSFLCPNDLCGTLLGKFPGKQATSLIESWRSIWEGVLGILGAEAT